MWVSCVSAVQPGEREEEITYWHVSTPPISAKKKYHRSEKNVESAHGGYRHDISRCEHLSRLISVLFKSIELELIINSLFRMDTGINPLVTLSTLSFHVVPDLVPPIKLRK